MKTRNIKTLLQIMLDNEQYFSSGLCGLTTNLEIAHIINFEEEDKLDRFIEKHRPNRSRGAYYWDYGYWSPRSRWLKYWIKRLSEK